MTWDSLMLHANAVICLLIMFRLMFFNKTGKSYRLGVSLFAYLIILSAGYTAFRIIHGDYMQVDPGEFMLNATVCVAVWLAGGNLAKFVRAT
ncbi:MULTISPECIES: phage holin family protein [Enterobacteriaceae]|uniref:phage holin family protein n=1 Tax=Enterobacteriaceae TaxID=543 RepID=UPI0009336670|nr:MULTISPECIES: phage holin family protein [Enterobacteriaceae]MCE0533252.1 phage holin family protein [Escherichia coli]MCE0549685.1 phage holin family protein [Escherichia coli]MCL0901721.1 phage holin family protein [Escherichia coli]QLD06773.1 phage holin family protein [Citrobacter freundii]QXN21422.1 phage holin family protein [Escherichia coli]